MDLIRPALKAIEILESNGFEAFTVGGAVRDFVMKKKPSDIDIATNALPEDILKVFTPKYKVIETGLKHGTLTVVINSFHMEITTYRLDGEYIDNRHPKEVYFTKNIYEDLSRRDFTINAMAYNPRTGILDPFDGMSDIKNKLIKCVGKPDKRFKEDALRIMRTLRFASVLDFEIEEETKNAIKITKNLLENISKERISVELIKFLCGNKPKDILIEYTDVFGVFIPEILALKNFLQYNPYHIYDVLTHTGTVVENIENTFHLRLAALLHDIGKPQTFTKDENEIGHFKGHPQIGEDIARNILHNLKFDNFTISKVCTLVKYHDIHLEPNKKQIKKWLNKLGEENFFDLLKLKKADILAQNPDFLYRIDTVNEISNLAQKIIKENECFSLKHLEINGNDLINMGISGKDIGMILNKILDMVLNEEISNSHEILIKKATEIANETEKN